MSKIFSIFHEKDGIFLSYKKEPKCLQMFCSHILIHTYKYSSALCNNEGVLHYLKCAVDTGFYNFSRFWELLGKAYNARQNTSNYLKQWTMKIILCIVTQYLYLDIYLWPRKTRIPSNVPRIPSNTLHLTVTVPPIISI